MKQEVCPKETALHVALYLLGSISTVLFAMIIVMEQSL